MSNYIGNQPSAGEFKKLDSIASSFNGSLTQFDLDYSTVNQSVGDATQLIVSLNGIIQEPGTAYTLGIGGGSIVFASAPASTDTCHIVLLGGVGGTTTPTDGSVTASKLDASLKDYLEETFAANGSQTVFTLTRAVVGANTLLVTIDGIVQPSSAFTASGTTLTISEVLAANTNVRVVHMGVKAGVYVPANDSVTADMLANSINTDIAAGVAALPKAGGTMTGDLTVEKSAPYINISNSAENIGGIKMYDNGGAATQYFNLTYDSGASNTVGFDTGASGEYTFSVNTDEKMRINSSGSLLVGKQAEEGNDVGAELRSNGSVIATVNNTLPMFINRKSSGTELVRFAFDNATVGSIGTSFGDITIGGKSGLRFDTDSSQYVIPYNVTDNAHTTAIDLGTSDRRFKDLYLSGGVYLGGTTAANYLDDYEEGTHQTSVTMDGSGTVTLNTSFDRFSYTKVGRLVTITGNPRISSVSSPVGNLRLTLPFTAAGGQTDECRAGGIMRYYDNSAGAGSYSKPVAWSIQEFSSTLVLDVTNTNGNNPTPAASDEFYFSLSYLTNA
jgi:hypothetical protein